ncbi:Peptidyl-tRNA hydrolase [uncultured archaeon]|nr:Peptidyl-tRNA hydrolase [uncultured archaeon]
MQDIKQVIVIRTDLKMGPGKLAAQAAHASLMSFFECEKTNSKVAQEWLRTGEKKIVLKVDDIKDLEKLFAAFKFKKIPCALVSDAGMTQVPPGTKTALGIGPWESAEINVFTSPLKLL